MIPQIVYPIILAIMFLLIVVSTGKLLVNMIGKENLLNIYHYTRRTLNQGNHNQTETNQSENEPGDGDKDKDEIVGENGV